MKKKTILNSLMILIVVLIAISGWMAVKTLKGPAVSADPEETGLQLSISDKSGIITVERSGIAYEVEKGAAVRTGDRFRSKKAAQLTLSGADGEFILGENSELKVDSEEFTLEGGELFADQRGSDNAVLLRAAQSEIRAGQAVLTVSAQSGSQSVYVYAGTATIGDKNVEAGQRISMVAREDGSTETEITAFAASALNDTQIKILQNCGMDASFCFSESDLSAVITLRQEEKAKAQQAQILLADQSKDQLKQEQQAYDQAYEDYLKPQTSTVVTESPSTTTSTATSDTEGSSNDKQTSGSSDKPTSGSSQQSGSESSGSTAEEPKYVTIEIRCDTILDNLSNLSSGKEGYVPGSGVILSTSKIEFEDGETVFDVLKRACDRAGIQLEYRYTPIYESYYIEGINHLYEFDCGDESGWMYKVNGWFPNYGCSSYVLEEDDVIVWYYTCNGLGVDVGAERF